MKLKGLMEMKRLSMRSFLMTLCDPWCALVVAVTTPWIPMEIFDIQGIPRCVGLSNNYCQKRIKLGRLVKILLLTDSLNCLNTYQVKNLTLEENNATSVGRTKKSLINALDDVEQFESLDTNIQIKSFLS
jgi:hypothetical protein